DPELRAGGVVDVDVEAAALAVEGLGPVDVRHGNDHELESEVHRSCSFEWWDQTGVARRASSSSRRSKPSFMPSAIPFSTMASRASTVWNTEWVRAIVRPSRSSSVSRSSETWPGAPSNSNVWTMPSGEGSPWKTPWNPHSFSPSVWT